MVREMSNRNDGRKEHIKRGQQGGKITKVPKRNLTSHLRPEFFGALIFAVIFIYLIINILFYANKNKVAIYEVQGDNISTENRFTGVALRKENIISSDYMSADLFF